MGTNFYWIVTAKEGEGYTVVTTPAGLLPYTWHSDDPRVHIGKRSAAGLYCWDCGVTLCEQGKSRIHYDGTFAAKCPRCGSGAAEQNLLREGAVAVELGFAKPNTEQPTGVCTTSSFNWAQDPAKVRQLCADNPEKVLIEDGYRGKYTGAQFLEMLDANCPIQFTDSVGHEFS